MSAEQAIDQQWRCGICDEPWPCTHGAHDGMQMLAGILQPTVELTEAEVNLAILVAGEVADLYAQGDRMPWLPVAQALAQARTSGNSSREE